LPLGFGTVTSAVQATVASKTNVRKLKKILFM
jgi:hypothetical protein